MSSRFSGDRWSNFDKFSTSLSRYPLRSKSPYRSNSSLSRASSTSNLKIEDDYFNALNKSLGAHDASFLEEDTGSVKNGINDGKVNQEWRYNSLTRPSSKSSKFNANRLNKDSRRYKSTEADDNNYLRENKYKFGSSDSYDNDLNNNQTTYSSGLITSKGVTYVSDSEPEYEPYSTSLYKYQKQYGSSSSKVGGKSSSIRGPSSNRGDHRLFDYDNDNSDGVESDESMSEYINCKSFCPDNLYESKLFHGIRSSISPSSTSTTSDHSPSLFADSSSNGYLQQQQSNDVHFIPIIKIRDQQAIRTAEFHPNGKYYAVGSNSKLLRVFRYSSNATTSHDSFNNDDSNKSNRSSLHELTESEEIYARTNYHKGSIYCLIWNKLGNLLATGSNDKTVKILPFNQETVKFSSNEKELNIHDGTVRDLCFMDDMTNGSSLLLSGGAGDCKVYITDCETGTTFLSLSGHSGPILSMYTWGGAMFVSGSQDRTIRFWDLRSNSCINFVTCPTISRNKPGGAVAAVCVDPSGKLLVSGHEDSTCMLYDIRGGRVIQTFHPHSADIRTIRFSNRAYYLLTGGYDNQISLTDLQGDLTQPLQSIVIASHQDKVIQCRWHPSEFTFLSTSADKSVMLWTLPEL